MSEFLRIWLEDNSYATVSLSRDTTATQVASRVLKRRRSNEEGEKTFCLFVVSQGEQGRMEVQMKPHESPLAVYEAARKNGKLLTFALKEVEPPRSYSNIHSRFTASSLRDARARLSTSGKAMTPRYEQDSGKAEYSRMWAGRASFYGYMEKMGEVNVAFKKRFFAIQDGMLAYYKTHTYKKPIKTVKLTDAFVRDTKSEVMFHLVTDKRVYHLRCASQREKMQWMVNLHQASRINVENNAFDQLQLYIEDAEAFVWEERLRFGKKISVLQLLLKSSQGVEIFEKYLSSVHSQENIKFWKAVQAYKGNVALSRDVQLDTAMDIYNTYLDPSARWEISIQGQLRQEILEKISYPDPDLVIYDEALNSVVSLMENTSFIEFLISPYFAEVQLLHDIEFDYVEPNLHANVQTTIRRQLELSGNLTHALERLNEETQDLLTNQQQPLLEEEPPLPVEPVVDDSKFKMGRLTGFFHHK